MGCVVPHSLVDNPVGMSSTVDIPVDTPRLVDIMEDIGGGHPKLEDIRGGQSKQPIVKNAAYWRERKRTQRAAKAVRPSSAFPFSLPTNYPQIERQFWPTAIDE